jgi:hypothetical protein
VADTSIRVFHQFLLKEPRIGTGVSVNYFASKLPGVDMALYARGFDYSIYEVGATGINRQWKIVLPLANTLPVQFFDSAFVPKQAEYLRSAGTKVITGFSNLQRSGETLLFSLRSVNRYYYGSYLYSNRSGNLYAMANVSTDSVYGFLPCIGLDGGIDAVDETYYYTWTPVYRFKTAYEDGLKNRKVQYPAASSRLYTSLRKNDNAIIIRLKPKSSI